MNKNMIFKIGPLGYMPVFSSFIVFAPLSKIQLSIICVGLFLDSILMVNVYVRNTVPSLGKLYNNC